MAAKMNFRPAGFESEDDEFDEDGFTFGEVSSKPEPKVYFNPENHPNRPTGGFGKPPSKVTNGNQSKYNKGGGIRWGTNTPKKDLKGVLKTAQHNGDTLPIDDYKNAVMMGRTEQIQNFIDQGLEVDLALRAGWSALMYAGNWANLPSVQLLLDNGADPNFNADCYTVLMATCASNKKAETEIVKCVNLLIEKGANVNAFDRFHMTGLMYAARDDKSQVVQRLLELEANMDKQDTRGYSALTWAVMKGHVRVVQILLNAGADMDRKTLDGSSPLDIAYAYGRDQIQNILKSFESGGGTSALVIEETITPPEGAASAAGGASSADITSASECDYYGELELFLSGLELTRLIPTFKQHHVTFTTFLRSTDHDLQQMGINSVGVRKKILDGIRNTHTKEWESSSLNSIQYNKHISCPESVAMLSNISKQAAYISATVGFVTDQIHAHPDILRTGQEGQSVDELLVKTKESMDNVKILYSELSHLYTHLAKMMSKENFRPPDLIVKKKPKKNSRRRRILGLIVGISVIGAAVWNKERIVDLTNTIMAKT